MRRFLFVAGLAAALLLALSAPTAFASSDPTAEDVHTLDQPRPAWLTDQLEAKIVAAGTKGVEIELIPNATNPNCLGTAPPYVGVDGVSANAVAAGACMVSPSGCTMNFVFTDGTSNYIGTAGHCAGNGKTVIAQVATRVDPTDTRGSPGLSGPPASSAEIPSASPSCTTGTATSSSSSRGTRSSARSSRT
jgi:hypothetical protein